MLKINLSKFKKLNNNHFDYTYYYYIKIRESLIKLDGSICICKSL